MCSSVRLVPLGAFFFVDSVVILIAIIAALSFADSSAFPASLDDFLQASFTFSSILRVSALYLIWVSSMRVLRLYGDQFITPLSEAIRISLSVGLTSFALDAFLNTGPRNVSLLQISTNFALFSFFVLFGFRALVALVTGSAWSKLLVNRNVIVVGSGPRAIRAYRELRTRHYRSHKVLGFVDINEKSRTPGEIQSLYLGPLVKLEHILFENVVDEVVIALPTRSCYAEIEQTIAICSRVGIEVKYPDDLFTIQSGVRSRERSHPKMVVIRPAVNDFRLFVKRCIDVAVSGAALLVLSPLFVCIAMAVKLTGRGPVLFSQERYGLARRRFRILKFRTMVPDAESWLPAIEYLNEAQGPIFKMRNDPRVTKVGAILRRTSLDELPQLFNVFVGQMSLVGPRPMSVRDVSRFSEAWLMRRFSVKPGITCLWQVNGRSNTTFDRWIELDLEYIDNWSLRLDAQIMALTIPAVVRGSGAM